MTIRLVSVLVLGLAIVATPIHVEASPAEQPTNLEAAAESAAEAREAAPGPETWLAEADAAEALGDLEGTEHALIGYLESLVDDDEARSKAEARLESIQEQRRGTVTGEPESTHRETLDDARAERLAALNPAKAVTPVDTPKAKETPIIKKWYFWVTLVAIVASAGAITGIAIKAAGQERKDALDETSARVPGPGTGGVLLRF
jgi:hypothetical protein